MKHCIIGFLGCVLALPMAAQETYQNTRLLGNDLNGTARYVGMGGAMEALGADISTISTNPAGLGLFRKGQVTLSGGFLSQPDATTHTSFEGIQASINADKNKLSFDQIGVVAPLRMGQNSYLNLGFNYHKSRNFNQILNAAARLENASQNKLSAIKYALGVDEYAWNGVDANYENLLGGKDDQGAEVMSYLNGTAYVFGQYQQGYIGSYDFCVSGNINDRIYLGITLGLQDVNYRSNTYYTENLEANAYSEMWESLKIDGTGVDIKFGAIFRPIEESPFRVGLYINTPVFYDLTMRGVNDVSMTQYVNDQAHTADCSQTASYDYKVYTPWKFGLSMGHTVANSLALGATYEYADYGSTDNRIISRSYYDPWYGDYYSDSESDAAMNEHSKQSLKGVHTLKLGMEYKPISSFALRAGYNFISSAFEKDAFRDGSIESPGSAYATSTDYTNWKATHRFTLGMGYQVGKANFDVAYQYNQTKGDFYPFMSYVGDENPANDNVASACEVKNNRHQFLFTVGYRF